MLLKCTVEIFTSWTKYSPNVHSHCITLYLKKTNKKNQNKAILLKDEKNAAVIIEQGGMDVIT